MKIVRLLTIAAALAAIGILGCADDEAAECGNGVCESGETNATCSVDCPPVVNNCGNSVCDAGETPTSCAADCPVNVCRNNVCDPGETESSCPQDCATPVCGDGTCNGTETTATCAQDCPAASCPDGICNGTETTATCPADCPAVNCEDIPTAAAPHTVCNQAAPCADGACLVQNANDTEGTCYQKCIPNYCTDQCAQGEVCYALGDADGNPIEISTGVYEGICDVAATGETPAYGNCSAEACENGMSCVTLDGITSDPFCIPECAATAPVCPSYDTYVGECALGASNPPTHCGLTCVPATPDCPTGMQCMPAGGGGLCLWPAS